MNEAELEPQPQEQEPEEPFRAELIQLADHQPKREHQPERLNDDEATMLNAALTDSIRTEAVKQFLMKQLAGKYQLGEGDQITPDGRIIRVKQ